MKLRTGGIILALNFGLLAAPIVADAQQPAKVPRIRFLSTGSAPLPYHEAIRQGLRETGRAEGRNIAIEYRWAEGRQERRSGWGGASCLSGR